MRPDVVIDCDTCTVRGDACGDCVVTVMLGLPGPVAVPDEERRALDVLARHGLIPHLRMEPAPLDPAPQAAPPRRTRPARRAAG